MEGKKTSPRPGGSPVRLRANASTGYVNDSGEHGAEPRTYPYSVPPRDNNVGILDREHGSGARAKYVGAGTRGGCAEAILVLLRNSTGICTRSR